MARNSLGFAPYERIGTADTAKGAPFASRCSHTFWQYGHHAAESRWNVIFTEEGSAVAGCIRAEAVVRGVGRESGMAGGRRSRSSRRSRREGSMRLS
jgi:hypothetical protein